MKRLAEYDVREMTTLPPLVTEFGVAAVLGIAFVGVRAVIDLAFPGAAPFALAFPVILVATLAAGWRCGALTLSITALYVWYYVLPFVGSFAFETPSDFPRLIINAGAGGLVIVLTQAFRESAREARATNEARLAERTLFLREIEHRVANNFQTVGAVLRLQQRRTSDPALVATLDSLVSRVESIARSHRHLYAAGGFSETVDMADYGGSLCKSLAEGLLADSPVALTWTIEPLGLPRDEAVVLGLIINELVTNAAKHAFPNGVGAIDVSLKASPERWLLRVRDDGKGIDPEARSGLGRQLLDDLVRQAGARLEVRSAPGDGTEYVIAAQSGR